MFTGMKIVRLFVSEKKGREREEREEREQTKGHRKSRIEDVRKEEMQYSVHSLSILFSYSIQFLSDQDSNNESKKSKVNRD